MITDINEKNVPLSGQYGNYRYYKKTDFLKVNWSFNPKLANCCFSTVDLLEIRKVIKIQ